MQSKQWKFHIYNIKRIVFPVVCVFGYFLENHALCPHTYDMKFMVSDKFIQSESIVLLRLQERKKKTRRKKYVSLVSKINTSDEQQLKHLDLNQVDVWNKLLSVIKCTR